MILAGELAVVRAARNFDLARGQLRFYPYARRYIYGAMWFAALEGFSGLYLPQEYLRQAVAVRNAFAELGEGASSKEIALASGVALDRVKLLFAAANHTMAIDVDVDFPCPVREWKPVPAKLRRALRGLTRVERDAIYAVYGGDCSVDVVAKEHGMARKDVVALARTVVRRLQAETMGLKQLALPA